MVAAVTQQIFLSRHGTGRGSGYKSNPWLFHARSWYCQIACLPTNLMNKMPRYSHPNQIATVVSVLLLQFVASSSRATRLPAYPSASGNDDATVCSFHRLDDMGSDGDLVVTTTSSILSPATFLFDAKLFPEFNRTAGFVLLSRLVQLWGNSDDDTIISTRREASFNTSFTMVRGQGRGRSPVSFVVLLDSFPPLATPPANSSSFTSAAGVLNASNSLSFVEVGAVGSYGPELLDVGLNVTVTPNGTATANKSTVVWIQYNAVIHRISVYVSAATGEPRPTVVIDKPLLDAPLNLSSRRTTQTAFVGFFGSTVRDVIHGVRNWELSVDRFPGTYDGDGEKGSGSTISARLLILLAVLGSVAAMIGVASVLVCYSLSRRRREQLQTMDHIMKQVYPQPTRGGVGFVGT